MKLLPIILLLGIGLILMGCIDISDFLKQQATEVFRNETNTTTNYTPSENTSTELPIIENETQQPEQPIMNKTNKTQTQETVECPEEYEDVYITKNYDPYYCIINMAVAKQNITICEQIPLNASDSLDRCIRVIATTYGKDPKWCEENLYRKESLEMCKRFVMFGHKRESY
ncbi:hypothetical protein J7J90_02550 [Candidatus Micrarchaeota archaeon]|nr:hypothetical protein [Candidatus Micrarchaeota archaeon]